MLAFRIQISKPRPVLKVLTTVVAARRFRSGAKGRVVLVPTMGALHEGHSALIRKARRIAGGDGTVVVSIFVNPSQFGPKEDLSRYPRPFAGDRKLCRQLGADAIFHPGARAMYSADFSTWVGETSVARGLCGVSRPGHFRGVCTVVLKLFTILQPDAAVFGLKDYQQCRVIARMVRDLNLPVRLVFAPTVRERDGLALSSRNVFLSPAERAEAPSIRRALLAARAAFHRGRRGASELRKIVQRHLSPMARVDYIGVVNGSSLEPVPTASRGDTIAIAAFFGRTRLIDNIQLR
jgi:pantoate--beta-alanine ligase